MTFKKEITTRAIIQDKRIYLKRSKTHVDLNINNNNKKI
jgi:hypothetical protein